LGFFIFYFSSALLFASATLAPAQTLVLPGVSTICPGSDAGAFHKTTERLILAAAK
jgi:hypothetical protein